MKSFLFLVCFAASVVLADDTNNPPVNIKFKDGTLIMGSVIIKPSDTQGFTLHTRFGDTRLTWDKVDVDYLQKSSPELYKFYLRLIEIGLDDTLL